MASAVAAESTRRISRRATARPTSSFEAVGLLLDRRLHVGARALALMNLAGDGTDVHAGRNRDAPAK